MTLIFKILGFWYRFLDDMSVARNLVQFICLWIYQRIVTLIFKILGFWYWFLDDMSIEEQAEYPVENLEIIIAN
jgi:hypothetical protein